MCDAPPLTIQFNGSNMQIPPGTSILGLLELVEMQGAVVAVEVNQEVVPREAHAKHSVQQNDIIEAVTLVGGG